MLSFCHESLIYINMWCKDMDNLPYNQTFRVIKCQILHILPFYVLLDCKTI